MDWLDQYLNGLGEYKTTVSPADTHIWGVKPKLNNVQERMIFDAVAQSEQEFRQIVQEARTALEEHGHSEVADAVGADPGSPARASSPSVTTTPTVTPSIAVSPTPTPTITVTPSITPTMTVTPTITPSSTTYPGMLAANSPLIAVNYGNQSTLRFGTNKIVTRNYGYDPDIMWDWDSGTPPGYYVIFLDFNFNIPGAWSFQLYDTNTPSNRYMWKNNSTNSLIVPSAGWYGYAGYVNAGTTNLILSAIPVSPTPTPTVTPTITPTITQTPTITPTISLTPSVTQTPWTPATAFVALTTLAISAYLADQPFDQYSYSFYNLRDSLSSWRAYNFYGSCDGIKQGIYHDGTAWKLRFHLAENVEYVGCVEQYDFTYTNNSPSNVVPLTGWPSNVRIGKYLYNDGGSNTITISGVTTSINESYQITRIGPYNRFYPIYDYFSSGTTLQLSLCGNSNYVPFGVNRRLPTMVSSNTSIATVNNADQTITFVGGGNVTIALTSVQDNNYVGTCTLLGLRSTNISNPLTYIWQFSGGSVESSNYQSASLSGIRVYLNNWSNGNDGLPFMRSGYVARLSGSSGSGGALRNRFFQLQKGYYGFYGQYVAVLNDYTNYLNNCASNYSCYTSYAGYYGGLGATINTTVTGVSADYDRGLPIIPNIGTIY